MHSASSRTVVERAVERLKSSLTAVGRLHREADAVGEVAAVRVVADLRPVAEDVERVLALEDLQDEVRARRGDRASFTLPDMMSVSRRARRSPMPTQLNGRTIVYGSWYCSQAPFAKYSDASFWKP